MTPEPITNPLHGQSLTPVAWILRAAACYLLRHGLYLNLSDFTDPDDVDRDLCDPNDHYDWSTNPLTPAASPQGAIAMAIYGRPVPHPATDDGRVECALFQDALGEYLVSFAPDGCDYGPYTTVQDVAEDLIFAADERDRTAGYTCGGRFCELDLIALSTFGVNPRTPDGSPNGGGGR